MYQADAAVIKERNEIIDRAVKAINDERIKAGMKPIQGKQRKIIDELDYTNQKSVPNFDTITSNISNLYPGHFHGFAGSAVLADAAGFDRTTSESTSDMQKLWDIIGEGKQTLPDIKEYHNKAFEEWEQSNPKKKESKPAFEPIKDSPLTEDQQRDIHEKLPLSSLKGITPLTHQAVSKYLAIKESGETDPAEFLQTLKSMNSLEIRATRKYIKAQKRNSKEGQINSILEKAGLAQHAIQPEADPWDQKFGEQEKPPNKAQLAIEAWAELDHATPGDLFKLLKAANEPSIYAEPAERYVAPTGKGKRADDRDALFSLMKSAMKTGSERMSKYVQRGLRTIGIDRALRTGILFTPEDRQAFQDDLASTIATADLLGRTRVRQRAEAAYKRNPQYSRYDEPGKAAGQAPKNLSLLTPMEAYDYFTNLTPTLNVHPDRFGPLMERRAFTVAVATEKTLLEEIQKVIADSIRDGEPGGAVTIRQLMIETGTAPNNPQYAEAVYRTNVMDSAAIGHDREMQSEDMRETFPVFEYSAIVGDGRGRSWHVKKNGLLYPSGFLFTNVRGTSAEDVINCRCTPIAIDKFELADRLERGETIQTSY